MPLFLKYFWIEFQSEIEVLIVNDVHMQSALIIRQNHLSLFLKTALGSSFKVKSKHNIIIR